jgi:hypothetical protein
LPAGVEVQRGLAGVAVAVVVVGVGGLRRRLAEAPAIRVTAARASRRGVFIGGSGSAVNT